MKELRIEDLQAYEVVQDRRIEDLDSRGLLLRHKKTGAKITLLSNADENKVFYVGFRTPPANSTGVAHILEHCVLCGSDRFPAKDPFIELAKGSLNTFLNAMTYPDKTIYPVASCNDKDFQNLMHVYLDAVFHPRIYQEKKIFMQEGWHFEVEDGELVINGVVYNEMKGAFSSPDDVLEREIFNSLFPDTCYSHESGGNPEVIPDLTYEEFLDFHRRYYHPSNSYIYLYGNMDMEEKLKFLDEEYLSKYEMLSIDSEVAIQKAFSESRDILMEYSITDTEPETENSYLSYNAVTPTNLDQELYVAFQVLDYALCSAPGAPLKKALLAKGIGKDVYSVYENGILQPYFSIVAKNTDLSRKEEFLTTIKEVLSQLVKEGMDKLSLRAALNYFEFKYREADFGSYPKGLMYGLQILDSWIYNETQPFVHIEANETFRILKQKAEENYFEELIESYLLDNPHKSIVSVVPVKGLTARNDAKLKEKLKQKKAGMTSEELDVIKEEARQLIAYQEEPSSREDLLKIPLLKREDIKKEAQGFCNQEEYSGKTLILTHPIFTNGISYMKLLFDIAHLPKELFSYLGLLKAVLGLMDTENYSYGDLFNEVNLQTGGISTAINTYVNAKDMSEYKLTFEIRAKALYGQEENAFKLMQEILLRTVFEDKLRLKEIISEAKSKLEASFLSAGHSVAAIRAMSYFSATAAIAGEISGIPFYLFLEKVLKDYENQYPVIFAQLKELTKWIFTKENLMVDYTGTKEGRKDLLTLTEELKSNLYAAKDGAGNENNLIYTGIGCENEGFLSSSQVQYVCRAGNFVEKGYSYTGALRVLRVIMGYEYLWNNIRVKGGAYGCMCNFGRTGDSYFVSYRDPNLKKTVEVYEKAPDFVEHFEADERILTQYIIGTISDFDIPLNPYALGARSLAAYLSKQSFEEIQKERDEILTVGQKEIRALSGHLRAFLEKDCLCVVGNEDKIKEQAKLFHHLEHLIR